MTTILLADDDPMQHELVQATLGRAHRVLHAWDGREALEIARQEHPDLVLLDVTMPVIDGFEACRQLKADAATRDIIVVMLSARSEVSDRQRGLAVGADQYVTKPFRPSALLDLVGREPDSDHARQPRTAPAAEAERPADQPAEVAQTLAYARDVSALYEAAQERAERFRLLVEVGKDLMAARGVDALLRLALERAASFSGCEDASVLLVLRPEGPLEVRASVGEDPVEPGTRVDDLSRSVAGQALRTQRPLVIEGEAGDLGIGWGAPTTPIASAICLPLVTP